MYYVSDNDWSSSHNWDYWNINFTNAASVDNTPTAKTVYDPSVSGFTLPRMAAFTGFTSTGNNTSNSGQFNVIGSFVNGWNYYTNGWKSGGSIFFAALGARDAWSGRIPGRVFNFNVALDIASSGAISNINTYILYCGQSSINPQYVISRSYGLNVRSVLE